jgi:hypothetical protein
MWVEEIMASFEVCPDIRLEIPRTGVTDDKINQALRTEKFIATY